MKALLLTLGHNSSAVMIENDQIVWGYETERLSGLKSDSRFPMPWIEKLPNTDLRNIDIVYVTHWAPDGQLSSMSRKHWDPFYFDGVPIRTLSADRTHHDTHMAAADCYAGPAFTKHRKPGTFGFVVDGFGTMGEHFSVYEYQSDHTPKLVRRVHGYGTSLGLWYQYATSFMGLKMHEDEYKLLGYEVHCPLNLINDIDMAAAVKADEWIDEMKKSIYGSKYDPLYDLRALENVKNKIFEHLNQKCKDFGVTDPTSHEGRCVLAYYVQAVLEGVVTTLIHQFKPKHVVLSGGCFYNVKLNKSIVDRIEGQTCVYPLAGDQGNALGLYFMDNPQFCMPNHFNWGKRDLRDVGEVKGLVCVKDTNSALKQLTDRLYQVGHVNLVRGSMEFGPRAMCNTSTLALPTAASVELINAMNDRNTVMPMAPVMTMAMYRSLFERWDRVWGSYRHMIVAMEYVEHPGDELRGVAHEYQVPYHHHTGRPQVVPDTDWLMGALLARFDGPLINTSFNFHGQPIAFNMESVIKNHMLQYQRDPSTFTVVITNE